MDGVDNHSRYEAAVVEVSLVDAPALEVIFRVTPQAFYRVGGTRIDCVVEQLDLVVSGPCNYVSVVVCLEVVPEEVGLAWLQVDVQSVEELE